MVPLYEVDRQAEFYEHYGGKPKVEYLDIHHTPTYEQSQMIVDYLFTEMAAAGSDIELPVKTADKANDDWVTNGNLV